MAAVSAALSLTDGAAVAECLNALPLGVRRGLFGGLPIGDSIILELPNEQAYYMYRKSGTLFQFTPMTKDEVMDRLLTEDTLVVMLSGAPS